MGRIPEFRTSTIKSSSGDDESSWASRASGCCGKCSVGGLKAYVAVKQGWRLHGYLDEQGVEHVEVIVKALPGSVAA